MFEKLEKVKSRYNEISGLLSDPAISGDQNEIIKLSKEFSEIEDIVKAYDSYLTTKKELEENRQLLYETSDQEMKELARGEQEILEERMQKIEAEIKELLIPEEPADNKNAIIEIRSGTGGEEASLFAADLYSMYSR